MKGVMKKCLVFLIIVALSCNGCASRKEDKDNITFKRTPPVLTDRDRREIELGTQIHEKILQSFPIYEEPQVNEYVTSVGMRLAPYAKRNNLPYAFTILQDNRIYASSAPGGFVYITTGFLNMLENEAELAAVLGQEIAQCQYRPPDPRLKTFVMNSRPVLGIAGGFFLGIFTPFAMIGVDALTYYSMLEKKKSDRAVAADKQTFEYMIAAGYDPQGAIDLFYDLMEFDESQIAMIYNYNISHPLTNRRFEKMEKSFKKLDITGKELITGATIYTDGIGAVKTMYDENAGDQGPARTLPII
jgi:predicted Zn-dependent protease